MSNQTARKEKTLHTGLICRECGTSFEAVRHDADFCQTSCRSAWNNRRMKRGAELYDIFMFMRHERKLTEEMKKPPTDINLWTIAAQLATHWKQEDQRDRAGRRSFQFIPNLIEQGKFTHLKTVFVGVDKTGQF